MNTACALLAVALAEAAKDPACRSWIEAR